LGYNPSNLDIESGCKERIWRWAMTVFASPALKALPPNRPNVDQQAQNILVFRAGICQTQQLTALVLCLDRHSPRQFSIKNVQTFFKLFSTGLLCLL
jgi:hypothetical protein